MEDIFYNISERMKERVYEAHSGNVIYCNDVFIKELGHDYDLILGEHIYLGKNFAARVVKVFKEKTNKDKKWWQFWIRQKEYVTGYHLEIM